MFQCCYEIADYNVHMLQQQFHNVHLVMFNVIPHFK